MGSLVSLPLGVLCPHCQSHDGRHLAAISKVSHVDYYRCATCHHVWNQPKAGDVGKAHDVTVTQHQSK